MSELIDNFHFLRPWWLTTLLPVMVLGWWLLRTDDPSRILKDSIAPHLLKSLTISTSSQIRFRPEMLALPLWITAVFALAGPAWRTEPPPWTQDSSSLYLVVRITPSMISEDVPPNRLERVRAKLHDVMELRRGSRTGLVAYAKSAHLVMPATDDSAVIDQMLQSLDPGMMPGDGDSLADALAIASDHIEGSDSGGSILVVADGGEATEIPALIQWRKTSSTPVQWMVPVPAGSSLAAIGVAAAADAIASPTMIITPDDADVESIAKRAAQSFSAVGDVDGTQWRDEGVWLVWPIAIGLAFWFRKGWSLKP